MSKPFLLCVSIFLAVSTRAQEPSLGTPRSLMLESYGAGLDSGGSTRWEQVQFGTVRGRGEGYFDSEHNLVVWYWEPDTSSDFQLVAKLYDRLATRYHDERPDELLIDSGKWNTYYFNRDSVVATGYWNGKFIYAKQLRSYLSNDTVQYFDSTKIQFAPSIGQISSEENEVLLAWCNYLLRRPEAPVSQLEWSLRDPVPFDMNLAFPHVPFVSECECSVRITGIEPEENGYAIFTYYPLQRIHEVAYSVYENEGWRFRNALFYSTRGWSRDKVGQIAYIHPPKSALDTNAAEAANRFVDSIRTMFQLPRRNISYCYGYSGAVRTLIGVDKNSYLEGEEIDKFRLVLTNEDNSYFRHELVHASLASIPAITLVSEGAAVYLAHDSNFRRDMQATALALDANTKISFHSILTATEDSAQFPTLYCVGAMILTRIEERAGQKALVDFYRSSTSEDGFYRGLHRYLQVDRRTINAYIRREMKAYE